LNGKKIKVCRENAKITQRDFAAAIGIANSNVCNWERQNKPIPIKYNQRICEVLGLEPEPLYLKPELKSVAPKPRKPRNPKNAKLTGAARLELIRAVWHLLPISRQCAMIDIVTQHLNEINKNSDLLS
jgi:transcriptional regulator with XRE-family HTH domain